MDNLTMHAHIIVLSYKITNQMEHVISGVAKEAVTFSKVYFLINFDVNWYDFTIY